MKKPTSLKRREKLKRQKERLKQVVEKDHEAVHISHVVFRTPLPSHVHQDDILDTLDSGSEAEDKSWDYASKRHRLHVSILQTPESEHSSKPVSHPNYLDAGTGASSSAAAFFIDASIESLREVLGSEAVSRFLPVQVESPEEENVMDATSEEEEEEPEALSNKKQRRMNQVPVAQLKQSAKHPDVVEWEDSTAKDPYFLVKLKCLRNTLPVPRHWSRKRRYLGGKRGFFKSPIELPDFLQSLNITQKREELLKADAKKTQKVKAREKMHPKLGRMPLDFQRMYDAFFKYQTRPQMTAFGDVYYEGKELEGKRREKRPGHLSPELRAALGMGPPHPPPWLFAMQRFGGPPAHPLLRVAGLTAPLPPGAQWGYHPGGWGKPPAHLADSGPSTGLDGLLTSDLSPKQNNTWAQVDLEEEVKAPEEDDHAGDEPEE